MTYAQQLCRKDLAELLWKCTIVWQLANYSLLLQQSLCRAETGLGDSTNRMCQPDLQPLFSIIPSKQ